MYNIHFNYIRRSKTKTTPPRNVDPRKLLAGEDVHNLFMNGEDTTWLSRDPPRPYKNEGGDLLGGFFWCVLFGDHVVHDLVLLEQRRASGMFVTLLVILGSGTLHLDGTTKPANAAPIPRTGETFRNLVSRVTRVVTLCTTRRIIDVLLIRGESSGYLKHSSHPRLFQLSVWRM